MCKFSKKDGYGLSYAERMYLEDPFFHQLVDALMNVIRESQLTPAEVRQAAVFASTQVELTMVRTHFVGMTPDISRDPKKLKPVKSESAEEVSFVDHLMNKAKK
jgi:hypothetical protein